MSDTNIQVILQALLLGVLISCSACFSGTETALFSLSRARLLAWKKDLNPMRRLAARLMSSYHKTLIALILGNMFVNVAISVINDSLMDKLHLPEALSLFVTLCSSVLLLLVLGEITPKTIAIFHAERFSQLAAGPVWALRWLLSPLLVLIDKISGVLLEALGRRESPPLNHEEYLSFVESARKGGAFSTEEAIFIETAIGLSRRKISEIMSSRLDISAVHIGTPANAVAEIIRKTRRHYLPVIKEDLDEAEFLLSSEEFLGMPAAERDGWEKSPCVQPALFIPEASSVTKALATMRSKGKKVALVTDEYGGLSGLVSLSDIYRELIGEPSHANCPAASGTLEDLQL
ncbi:MAG: hypothetical protein A2X49_04990 [Lentisphaerae bacterium GWF2_52_8]|nr:MAG: hypothetical protein A2X49_04990 [Lentisphaerae bacterium GWF2_52_8]